MVNVMLFPTVTRVVLLLRNAQYGCFLQFHDVVLSNYVVQIFYK